MRCKNTEHSHYLLYVSAFANWSNDYNGFAFKVETFIGRIIKVAQKLLFFSQHGEAHGMLK